MIRILAHKKILTLIFVGVIILLIGAALFSSIEGWSFLDSLHYTVSLFTTVGFGDVIVTKNITKILAIVYMLIGVPLFIAAITLSTEVYYDQIKRT